MANEKFVFVEKSEKLDKEQLRPSLTYWQDVWRRLKGNRLAMAGLVGVVMIILFGVFGPSFSKYSYEDQILDFANISPKFEVYQLEDDLFVFLTSDYKLVSVNGDGELLARHKTVNLDVINKRYTYDLNGNEEADDGDVIVDFSYKLDPAKADEGINYSVTYKGIENKEFYGKMKNKTFVWGSDNLGRDILTRVMYGARISLTIAFVATIVNLLIGVTYGSISGYEGGRVDNIMMRIVDIINSIPLLLYVILLMVIFTPNEDSPAWFITFVNAIGDLGVIIIALASVYWVGMARLVRGQVLGLKEQEFVLAARTIGVSKRKIIFRHLIPNAMGPIIVSMTMMIPSAVFTEAFLSFIGLGVSAPMASWGTLANDSLGGLTSYPYQLFYPAAAIAITMLAFNFLGDGLRDALDPRLRKG